MKKTRAKPLHPFMRSAGILGCLTTAFLGAFAIARPEILWSLHVDLVPADGLALLIAACIGGVFLTRGLWRSLQRFPAWRAVALLLAPFVAAGMIGLRTLHTIVADEDAGRVTAIVDSADPVHIAFAGDVGRASRTESRIFARIADLSAAHPIASLFLAGDNIYGNDPYAGAYAKRLGRPLAPIFAANVPVHAVLGSHDITSGYAHEETNEPRLGMNDHRYYEWTTKDSRCTVFALDSERLPTDPAQYRWLAGALKTCKSPNIIIFTHGPLEASDVLHGGDRELARLLMPLFKTTDVDLLISGKNHIYERRHSANGHLAFVTVGSSGKVSHPAWPEDSLRDTFYTESGVFLDISIAATKITGVAMTSDGRQVDHFELESDRVAHSPG
ncbi:hypothetical protein BH09SUM1_BH09SUM1_28020 [soil metagenome]